MDWTRNLRKGMSGADVMEAKQRLLALGYYAEHITTLFRSTFGGDTYEAVCRFQAQEGLPVDGVIGSATWEKLFFSAKPPEAPTGGLDASQASETQQAVPEAEPIVKTKPSTKALMLCTLALQHIGDIYVWSESGCKDLSDSRIRSKDPSEYARAMRFRDAQYKAGLTELLSHDCSGFISYLMRMIDVWENRRDCDGLWSYCDEVHRNELIAGDFLFRHESGNPANKTHVGLYIGNGKVIHCKGRDTGVVLEGINKGGSGYWHVCGRCRLLYTEAARAAKEMSGLYGCTNKQAEPGHMDRMLVSGIV